MDFSRPTKFVVVWFFIFISVFANSYPLIPHKNLTYGQLCNVKNPDFTSYRYSERIPYCERNVSREQKNKIYNLYKIPESCRSRYTIDHFIPLSIGGDNSDVNLWPEHKLVKATRPQLEQKLYEAIKSGRVTQKLAIEIIVREKTKLQRIDTQISADNCDTPNTL